MFNTIIFICALQGLVMASANSSSKFTLGNENKKSDKSHNESTKSDKIRIYVIPPATEKPSFGKNPDTESNKR